MLILNPRTLIRLVVLSGRQACKLWDGGNEVDDVDDLSDWKA